MSEITFRGSRDSVTVVIDDEPYTVHKGTANYKPLMAALAEGRMEDVPDFVNIRKAVAAWADGEFSVKDDDIVHRGNVLRGGLSKRVLEMITSEEDPSPLLRGFERLDRNPDNRSVEQTPGFLVHEGIPFEPDGTFLAYKSVRANYMDHHTGKISNKPGQRPKVARNRVSSDPAQACHFGLHVGALSYAKTFGKNGRIVIVRVDPEHVVCVPKDESQRKMRVCEYEVVGDWSGHVLPSTTMETDTDRDTREGTTPKQALWSKPKTSAKDMPKRAKAAGSRPKFVPDPDLKARWETWDNWGKIPLGDLLLGDLRQYATYHANIVGASKIPGGKDALVDNILEVRAGGHK